MKRKKFLALGSFMFALVAFAGSYHAYTSYSTVEESDLLMANVEALASNNGEAPSSDSWPCWSETKNGGGVWVCGSPCVWAASKNKKSGESVCHK